MADEELPEEDDGAEEPRKPDPREPESRQPLNYRGPEPKAKPAGPRFFTIYKKGQGYWTRIGTAVGAGLLGAMVAFEIYDKLKVFLPGASADAQHRNQKISAVAAAAFLLIYSLWAFWFTNKPTTVDFLVATDSEMKKVNWATRKELIGSTKIVIVFMFLIALYLFVCDLLFGGFFRLVHVLKTWF